MRLDERQSNSLLHSNFIHKPVPRPSNRSPNVYGPSLGLLDEAAQQDRERRHITIALYDRLDPHVCFFQRNGRYAPGHSRHHPSADQEGVWI